MTITVFYQKLNDTRRVDDAFFDAKYSAYDAETEKLTQIEGDPAPRIATAISRLVVFGRCYLPVAKLDTTDLDEAWKATQSIDSAWTEGPLVKEFLFDDSKHIYPAEGRRSAMVGDIYAMDEPTEFGVQTVAYVVASTGFIKIAGLAARRLMNQLYEVA
jgi:hypothetical protein